MAPPIIHQLPEQNRVLVVDDEPAVHSVTKLSVRGLRYADRDVELLSAESGTQAVEMMRANPDVAVILMDVVMESDSAGLDACRTIRDELNNHLVRILLRTGQPGQAPEKKTIEGYDLDGYLAKAEIDANRLYSALRSALKSWHELVQLQRHERYMEVLHERAMALHSYDPLPLTLSHILEAALELCPATMGAIELQSFEQSGNPQRHFVHLTTGSNGQHGQTAAEEIRSRISHDAQIQSIHAPQAYSDGVLVPLRAHRDLGYGWLYLNAANVDELTRSALTVLAGHAANALYSSVAESMLGAQEDDVDSLAI